MRGMAKVDSRQRRRNSDRPAYREKEAEVVRLVGQLAAHGPQECDKLCCHLDIVFHAKLRTGHEFLGNGEG